MIKNQPLPKTGTDKQSFLRFTNYYKRFIPTYIQIAKPLYKLILVENASKKNKGAMWSEDCQKAFDKFTELCTTIPLLAFANFQKSFKLHTDASSISLGAVFYQNQEGVDGVKAL